MIAANDEACLLPRRPAPLAEESLYSWMSRLSMANGFPNPGRLLAYLGMPLPKMDLDFVRDGEVFHELGKHTGTDPRTLDQLTFRSYEGTLVRFFTRSGYDRKVLNEGHERPTYGTGRYVVCPHCLSQDEIPHLRKLWRWSYLTFCPEHRTALADACSSCGNRWVVSSTMSWDTRICTNCESHVSAQTSRPSKISSTFLGTILLELGTGLQAMKAKTGAADEVEFWDGVDWLTRFVSAGSIKAGSSPKWVEKCLCNVVTARHTRFEALSTDQREDTLCVVSWFLEHWPSNFLGFCKSAGVGVTDRYTKANIPPWVDDLFESNLRLHAKRPPVEKVQEAIATLISKGIKPSKFRVKQLLGLTESRSIDQVLPGWTTRFSQSDFKLLIEALDRRITKAPIAREEQAKVIRDGLVIIYCFFANAALALVPRVSRHEANRLWNRRIARRGARSRSYLNIIQPWWSQYTETIRRRYIARSKLDGHPQEVEEFFLTRFGEPYGGNGVPALMVELLNEIGYPHPERGMGVRKDLRFIL